MPPSVADLFLFCYERDFISAFLDLNLSVNNDTISTKIYDKRDGFDFEIVNFPFLDGDVPLCPELSQPIRFARTSSHVSDFNSHNTFLPDKLLRQGYRYYKLRKAFSQFTVDTLNSDRKISCII